MPSPQRKPKELHGTIRIKHFDGYGSEGFAIRINDRRWSVRIHQQGAVRTVGNWINYWTRSAAWTKLNYEGNKMIRVLIKKEPPFELHVVVNPTDALNIEKIEADGHYHVGDYDGEKQIDEAVASVATYLELEESHT
jgi:hypothetical protein